MKEGIAILLGATLFVIGIIYGLLYLTDKSKEHLEQKCEQTAQQLNLEVFADGYSCIVVKDGIPISL